WKLQTPSLIITVTGGGKSFKFPNPKTYNDFQRGFVAAAVTTSKSSYKLGYKNVEI
ncbi:unnamed protein product, partial [Didymodactylos carnosus]